MQRTFMLVLVLCLAILVYYLQPILTPFLVGMAFAYLGDPLVDRLERIRVGRTAGVILVFLVFLTLIVASVLVLLPVLMREVTSLIHDIPLFVHWLQETTSPILLEHFGVDPFDIKIDAWREQLAENWQRAGSVASVILRQVTASGFALMATLMNLALIPVVAFYLMRDWDHIVARIGELIPPAMLPTATKLARECDEVLSAFMRGQLLIMFLLGLIYAVGLSLVGLDLAILIGMLAGLASIVPYLGFAVGVVAATAAAVFQFQDLPHVAYVVVVFGIGQALEGMVLTPWLVGDRIGLHPVAVIFAILAGGQLFGFVGVLLALPIAAVIMVFLRHLHARYKTSGYFSRQDP